MRVVGDRIYHWLLLALFSTAFLCTLLMLISLALACVVDVVLHNRIVLHGIGYCMACVGASAALAGGAGLNNYTSRLVASGYFPYYHLIFEPAWAAMLKTPQSYYNNAIAIVVSAFVIFFYGLILIG